LKINKFVFLVSFEVIAMGTSTRSHNVPYVLFIRYFTIWSRKTETY